MKKFVLFFMLFMASATVIITSINHTNSQTNNTQYNLQINYSNFSDSNFSGFSNITLNISNAINNTGFWKPSPGLSWQLQLTGELNTNYDVDVYDIDLFDTPKEKIEELHSRNIKVICYFSAGSWENWRADSEDFPSEVLGNVLEEWPDEKWLDISRIDILAPIMEKRLDLAVEKGCDGVDPDNIDGYKNNNGFSLTYEEQLAYNKWLANEAHERGLSVGLKNDLEQIKDLVNYFDFAVNEQCFQYEECEKLMPFVNAGKAVFGVEYELDKKDFCDEAKKLNFSWLKMTYDLAGERDAC